jgi:hypothetical protein
MTMKDKMADALTASNFSHQRILFVFDEHFPSDDADRVLAIRDLGGKTGVVRGTDSFSKKGRRPINGMLGRLFHIGKLTALPVFRELSV